MVTGEGSLDEQSLQGKIAGEVATRCRQGGVACHAVVGRTELDPFDARILDLASVTEATTLEELERGRARRWWPRWRASASCSGRGCGQQLVARRQLDPRALLAAPALELAGRRSRASPRP